MNYADYTNLIESIDSQFTNQTGAGGSTHENLGARLKDLLGDSLVRVQKTSITEAQVLALFSQPIEILNSPGSGIIRIPTLVYIKRLLGTPYTLQNNSFSITTSPVGASLTYNINPNPLIGTIGEIITSINITGSTTGGVFSSYSYLLKANSGNPTGGTGGLDVYVTYIELTL